MATIAEAYALAGQHFQSGRFLQAEYLYRQILRATPKDGQAHYNLAVVLNQQGRLDDAISHYRQAVQLNPNDMPTHNNLGNALRLRGSLDEAVASFHQALRCQPDCAEVHNNLATALTDLGRFDDAVASCREALRLNPTFAAAWNNLGEALKEKRQLDEALSSYRQALQLNPQFPEALNSMGDAIKHTGGLDEALECFAEALRLRPNFGTAHWNRSLLWLLKGDFERGWPEYEWRWTQPSFVQRGFPQPLWNGSDLKGKTILLHAEQGLGDTLQFIRYAPLVKERGGRVVFESQPALIRLLTDTPGVDHMVARGSPLPAFEIQSPLLSLPRIMNTGHGNIPHAVPYLRTDAKWVENWRRELEPLVGLKVGIVWHGNPKFRADRLRSIPLKHFEKLAEFPGVRLISLQKEHGTDQLRGKASESGLNVPVSSAELVDCNARIANAGGVPVLDLSSRLEDFTDTAAVVKNLDLVISCDTAVAHLTGALGMPVWLALAFIPDWRWQLDRLDSPWYPTMRLFRQSRPDQWEDVFERIVGELRNVVENHKLKVSVNQT